MRSTSILLVTITLIISAVTALPTAWKSDFDKREDSVDRSQDAVIGGALRGIVIPDINNLFPTNPLGGQPPDDD